MYLRGYQRTKDGKRQVYFALVEAQRTERGPRQRIVAQLGELTEDQQRRWQPTAIFHARHEGGRQLPLFLDDEPAPLPDDPDMVRIRLGKVGWTNAEQMELLASLQVSLPERICADREMTDPNVIGLPSE